MRIAEHHKPGHWLAKETAYVPSRPWPEQCYVQWGSSGLVFSAKGNYGTAFFEAFPGDNAGGFIRGEGGTVAEAEAAAYAKYEREAECRHLWGREDYRNGGALCRRCRAFKMVFREVVELGHMRKPLSLSEDSLVQCWEEGKYSPTNDSYARQLRIRKHLFGVRARQN